MGMASVGARPVRTGSTPTEPHPRMRASGVRPCAAAYSSLVSTTAAAPSFSPAALPAVTVPPSSSGCSRGSAASRSIDVSARGCSSVSKTRVPPLPSGTSTGTICSLNQPSAIDCDARWCECSAHSSDAARLMPASRAVFSPTVMDMSHCGASACSGWLGDIHGCGS